MDTLLGGTRTSPLSYNEPMRSFFGKLRPRFHFLAASLLLLLLCGALAAGGQILQQTPQLPTPPGQGGARVPLGQSQDENPDQGLRRAQDEAAKLRNLDRQKRLVADTNKLLELAQELKVDVDKSNKDTLSLSVVKKADEIEKLAKSVKERMKSE